MLSIIFKEYFFLRQRIPIFLYLYYIHNRDLDNPVIDRIMDVFLTFIATLTIYTFSGSILGIPFRNLIPLRWHYYGLLHWCVFFVIFYLLAIRKDMSRFKSLTLATLATVGGGWLYEIPLFHPESMFISPLSILYVNGQIVYLLFLGYELRRMNFKPNKTILFMMLIFTAFSVVLYLDRDIFWRIFGADLMRWCYRTPASLFLLSLLSGVEKRRNENDRST